MATVEIVPDLLPLCVPIDSVRPNPANYRRHPDKQVQRLAASVRRFRVYRAIVVNGDGVIMAGHGIWEAVKACGGTVIPRVINDLGSSTEETALMIADNTQDAEDDTTALAELLRQLQAEDALGGTGYDDVAVEALLKEVAGAMPTGGDAGPNLDPGEGRYREQYGVIVMCADEAEQEEIYNALLEQGYTCKVVVT